MTRIPLLVVILCLALADMSSAQERPVGILPVGPETLLPVLPSPLEGWKLKSSTATTEYKDWLESSALRIYQRLPVEGAENEGPPSLARISIVDTARQGNLLDLFADFEAGESQGSRQMLMIQSHPAIRNRTERADRLLMLIQERFVLEILIRDPNPRDIQSWLRVCQVQSLSRVPDSEPVPLPAEITILKYDELKPQNSRSYQVSLLTGDEVAQQVADGEAFQKRIQEAIEEGRDFTLEELDVSALEE